MRFAILAAVAIAALSSSSPAQRASAPPPPYQRALLHSDSIDIGAVAVSPDGKWLAIDGTVRGLSSIWVVRATGGEIHRITEGPHEDHFPVWFPGGDRIAFSTNRVKGIMSIGFDAARGLPVGMPKRISVEPTVTFDISPDGRSIVYNVSPNADGKARIRLAPATGGAARTIYEGNERIVSPRFSSDARTVYFTSWQSGPTIDRVIKQIPVGGGAASVVPLSNGSPVMVYPRVDRIAASSPRGLSVRTMSGDSIVTLSITRSTVYNAFSFDGHTLYQPTSESGATIRLVSTDNGATIDLTPPNAPGYAYPYGWTDDNRVVYQAANDRTDSVFIGTIGSQRGRGYSIAPINPLEEWKPTSRLAALGDGRTIAMTVVRPGGPGLYLLDLQTRRLTELTKRSLIGYVATADWTHRKEFYFFEPTERGVKLSVVRANEQPRVVAMLPSDAPLKSVSIIGDRVLFRKQSGDSTVVFTLSGNAGGANRIATLPGSVSSLVPSRDGRWLAGTTAVGRVAASEQRVVFLALGADGLPSGPPRLVATDYMWDLAWTPDGRAVIGLEEEGMSTRTRIRRIPVDAREAPSTIGPTNTTFWDAYLSPDGKYVAVPVEQTRGSTLWAFDLKEAVKARR